MTLVVLLWVVCGIGAAVLAQMKGRSAGWFFLAGVLFGPFGLAYAAFADRSDEMTRGSLSKKNW